MTKMRPYTGLFCMLSHICIQAATQMLPMPYYGDDDRLNVADMPDSKKDVLQSIVLILDKADTKIVNNSLRVKALDGLENYLYKRGLCEEKYVECGGLCSNTSPPFKFTDEPYSVAFATGCIVEQQDLVLTAGHVADAMNNGAELLFIPGGAFRIGDETTKYEVNAEGYIDLGYKDTWQAQEVLYMEYYYSTKTVPEATYTCGSATYTIEEHKVLDLMSMDAALIRLERKAPVTPLKMATPDQMGGLRTGAKLWSMGYSNGQPLKYVGEGVLDDCGSLFGTARLEVFHGNSGGPIFAESLGPVVVGVVASAPAGYSYNCDLLCWEPYSPQGLVYFGTVNTMFSKLYPNSGGGTGGVILTDAFAEYNTGTYLTMVSCIPRDGGGRAFGYWEVTMRGSTALVEDGRRWAPTKIEFFFSDREPAITLDPWFIQFDCPGSCRTYLCEPIAEYVEFDGYYWQYPSTLVGFSPDTFYKRDRGTPHSHCQREYKSFAITYLLEGSSTEYIQTFRLTDTSPSRLVPTGDTIGGEFGPGVLHRGRP